MSTRSSARVKKITTRGAFSLRVPWAKACSANGSARRPKSPRPRVPTSWKSSRSSSTISKGHDLLMFSLALLVALQAPAQVNLPAAKPVPRMQVLPLPDDQASITCDGREIARYYFGKDLYRPFLYPIVGPSGRSLTRMGHPRDPNTHSH